MENKKTYEELKEELDKLFNAGKIDQIFYEKEMAKLDYKIREKAKREKANKVQVLKNKSSVVLVIVILVVSIGILFFTINKQGILYGEQYEEVIGFDRLPAPEQKRLKTEEIEFIEVLGQEYKVKLVYEYTIYGRVVGTLGYDYKTEHGTVVPKDVGLVFGPLTQDKFLKYLKFESKYIKSIGRVLLHRITSSEGERILTNMGYGSYISNNHILGCDERVNALIDKIDVGNYIKIEGYLCEVIGTYDQKVSSMKQDGKEYTIIDSDYEGRNNNDCETIYVTDVKWLKEK